MVKAQRLFAKTNLKIQVWRIEKIGIDGGSVNYEKDCMCNAMYSACI